jgi:N-carbamoyl-L-amino-acid hydrolase
VDAERVIADLRELARRTAGPEGARRVCWTAEWALARDFLRELLATLPVEVSTDQAGNLWAVRRGRRPDTVAVGSHLDSVPSGGWLDGALGVMAGVEVLRVHAEATPECSLALVDWADEEGARFGRSLLGSSAFAGTLDAEAARQLVDGEGVALADALAEHGVSLDEMARAGEGRRDSICAYAELHIEQGPVLEAAGLPCGAVLGTVGVERHRVTFRGRAAHAGSTPMEVRRDAGVAAARTMAGLGEVARAAGGVCTAGRVQLDPGIATAVAGRAELLVDQRHLDPEALAEMLSGARELWNRSAESEGCAVEAERVWAIEPIPFDERLVAAARAACRDVAGSDRALPSGALHDASELARIVPAAMIFSSSTGGISHAPEEDTPEPDLRRAIEAFGLLAGRLVREGP